MLFLQIPLLAVLLTGGDNEDGKNSDNCPVGWVCCVCGAVSSRAYLEIHRLLSDIGPCFLLGLLDDVKTDLQRGQSHILPPRIF
ncbi:uncharacterized protein WM277_023296 [Molossus nigricans]